MTYTGAEITQAFVHLTTSKNATKQRENSLDLQMDSKMNEDSNELVTTGDTVVIVTEPPLDPADPEYAWYVKPAEMPPVMSPIICREGLLMRFEELVNQLSSGWKYHVANTEGIKDSWKHFEKYFQSVCSYTSALVGPPANVTVQALSNDSVVVQWDFDEQLNGGLADGFVVKFIHEPGRTDHSSQNMDLWKAQTVMDPKARHMEISRLTVHKPYAFCVLAIKNSRLGPCSDPPTTIDKIFPNRVVQNLRALYKTSQSVNLHWDFNDGGESRLSGQKLSFYIKQSGMKTYRTQFLKEETLNAPGFERRIDGAERTFLWSNLRPYMNYTFKVGVYSEQDGRTYWPREITVRTDPTGPPLVDTPEFLASHTYGTANVRLKCATEEHGPISHYWLIVIPGNYSKDHVINVDSQQLVQNTNRVRQLYDKNPTIIGLEGKNTQRRALPSSQSSKEIQEGKIDLHVYANGHQVDNDEEEDEWVDAHESLSRSKREVSEDSGIETDESIPKAHVKHHKRKRRHNTKKKREPAAPLNLPLIDGVYISAQLSAQQVERMQRHDEQFVLGDGKEYGGFLNIPLDRNNKYRVMSRAFASDQGSLRFDQPFQFRAPMTEPASKLFTDSMISEPFSSKPQLIQKFASRASSLWFIAPIIVILILTLLIAMLVVYFLKCRRKTLGSGPFSLQNGGNTMQRRHGSITKIALGTDFAQLNGNGNGIYGPRTTTLPNETSKLLVNGNGTHTANGTLNRSDLNGHAHFGSSTQSQPLYDLYQPNGAPPGTLSISQNNLNDGPNPLNDPYYQHQYNSQQRRPNGGLQLGVGTGKFGTLQTPIPLNEFPSHVEHLKQNNNELFIKEFESIETDQHFTWEHSNLEVNKPKNRYANIIAYDHSRVVLTPVSRSATGGPRRMRGDNLLDDLADDLGGLGREDEDEEPGSDYINANYIDGFYKPRAYIATQGPLPETFADFWRMVWEERSSVVVMLTKLEERSRVKCSQYWPSRNSATYGHIVVTVLDTVELAHYTIRTMQLEHLVEREVREIKHTQYTSWPDHGVPDHPTPFLMFLKKVKALNPAGSGPIVTHCSAGVGRTGALIAIDCMVERIYAENTVDIYGCVKALRTQRMYMVQTEEQYIFIHDAVLDAAQSGSTEVPAVKLKQHIETNIHAITQGKSTGLDVEFQSLVALRPPNATFHAATQPVNLAKNRQPDQLPYDNNRVILQRINDTDGSDFINASWVDSYQRRRAYIATQNPMADTVVDFWRMLWEIDSCVVVMLTENSVPNGQMTERYAAYWPLNGPLRYGHLLVELISEYQFDNYKLHELRIAHVHTNESRTIRHFQFLNWPDRNNQNIEDLNGFIHAVHATKKQFGLDGPICVHCSNGSGRTGVFIAIATIIERMHLEQVVDVFTTVKLLRAQRPNMVETKAELELVYDAAMTYLNCNFPSQNDHLLR